MSENIEAIYVFDYGWIRVGELCVNSMVSQIKQPIDDGVYKFYRCLDKDFNCFREINKDFVILINYE
jgi:hypothetical protein